MVETEGSEQKRRKQREKEREGERERDAVGEKVTLAV